MSTKLILTKLFLSYTSLLGFMMVESSPLDWGQFGLAGAVIGALFTTIYLLMKPLITMMVEDKKSDAEIKTKLADSINTLTNVVSEHMIKTENNFSSVKEHFISIRDQLSDIKKKLDNKNN